jgi:hypothetical protein
MAYIFYQDKVYMTDIAEVSGLITKITKIKKKDKPVLNQIEKKKRGRKKKQVMKMTIEYGEFIIPFN